MIGEIFQEANIETSLFVVAKENEDEWRSVLASLYEHGSALAPVLVKHMCQRLLKQLKDEFDPTTNASISLESWSFPQVASLNKDSAVNGCFIAQKLHNKTDRELSQALDFVKTRPAGTERLTFLSVFLSNHAVNELSQAIAKAAKKELTSLKSVSFVSIYFGSSNLLPDGAEYLKQGTIMTSPAV